MSKQPISSPENVQPPSSTIKTTEWSWLWTGASKPAGIRTTWARNLRPAPDRLASPRSVGASPGGAAMCQPMTSLRWMVVTSSPAVVVGVAVGSDRVAHARHYFQPATIDLLAHLRRRHAGHA